MAGSVLSSWMYSHIKHVRKLGHSEVQYLAQYFIPSYWRSQNIARFGQGQASESMCLAIVWVAQSWIHSIRIFALPVLPSLLFLCQALRFKIQQVLKKCLGSSSSMHYSSGAVKPILHCPLASNARVDFYCHIISHRLFWEISPGMMNSSKALE